MFLDYVSIDQIKKLSKGHFFSQGASRFFNSRYPREGYRGMTAKVEFSTLIYFVTSEQLDYKSPRFHTIRVLNVTTGEVSTVGQFQNYKNRSTATRQAKKLASQSISETCSHCNDKATKDNLCDRCYRDYKSKNLI